MIPSPLPRAALLDEPPGRDQALGDSVFVVSRPALVKMLYRAGFPHAYEPRAPSPWEKPFRMRLWRAFRRLTR